MSEEIWKKVTISPYEEKYEVSSEGRVRSLHRNPTKILKQTLRGEYLGVQLNYKVHATHSVHRLVALAFLSNLSDYKIVNHKNGNKIDNRVDNLEWTTSAYNTHHAVVSGLKTHKTLRVSQYTLDGMLIKIYDSISQAMKETGVRDARISSVCKGHRQHSKGFVWKYTDLQWKPLDIPEGKEVVNFPNYIVTIDGNIFSKSHKKLISSRLNSGYKYVTLYNFCKDTKRRTKKDISIHILVAQAYIENPMNLPYVNHKNFIRSDNRLENLEWCSPSENMIHFQNKDK
jgi:hypothetical protein